MTYIVPNFRAKTYDNNGADENERLLDMLLTEEQGIEETPEHYLNVVTEMFDYAAPEGQSIDSMVFQSPKKNNKPTYH